MGQRSLEYGGLTPLCRTQRGTPDRRRTPACFTPVTETEVSRTTVRHSCCQSQLCISRDTDTPPRRRPCRGAVCPSTSGILAKRSGPTRTLTAHRVARKFGRSARQMPHDGVAGVSMGHRPKAEWWLDCLGTPAPGESIKRCFRSVYFRSASVCSSHGVRARSSTSLAFSPTLSGIVLLPTVDAADERSISLDDALNYNLRFGEMSSTGQQNAADSREFGRISRL